MRSDACCDLVIRRGRTELHAGWRRTPGSCSSRRRKVPFPRACQLELSQHGSSVHCSIRRSRAAGRGAPLDPARRGYHRRSAHGPAAHPQLLDHRAHRPRQVDARRPHPRADARRLAARDARAGARLDGPRARARDHDQGAGRARRVEGPRAEPDRHAGPRRLHLRGLALAPGVRGRAARRRRGAGDRGADARERLPRDREQPRDRPGRQQDRPAAGRPRRRRAAARRPARRRPRRRCSASRRRPGRASRTCSTRSSSGSRAPAGDPDAPPRALIFDSSYDQYRGVVAFVRVVDGAFHPREQLRAMALGTRFEAQEIGVMSPAMRPLQALDARARSAT